MTCDRCKHREATVEWRLTKLPFCVPCADAINRERLAHGLKPIAWIETS